MILFYKHLTFYSIYWYLDIKPINPISPWGQKRTFLTTTYFRSLQYIILYPPSSHQQSISAPPFISKTRALSAPYFHNNSFREQLDWMNHLEKRVPALSPGKSATSPTCLRVVQSFNSRPNDLCCPLFEFFFFERWNVVVRDDFNDSFPFEWRGDWVGFDCLISKAVSSRGCMAFWDGLCRYCAKSLGTDH